MNNRLILAATLAIAGCSSSSGPGGPSVPSPPAPPTPTPPPVALALQQVAAGLSAPLDLTAPPGDVTRLFIAEQTGAVRIVENGTLLPTPFLDLSGAISCCGERGLLGIAFHPNYPADGRLVVHYTALNGDSRVSAFTVSGNPNIADPASEQLILQISQPASNHNGGQVAFGPDGHLYLSLGDGGGADDAFMTGQSRTTLLGSILRIDIDGAAPYTVPADNPYAGHPTFRHELWNWGLRNPWRFSFDPVTGDMYIGDVGQGSFEEIDFQPAASSGGENYGWSIMEGFSCFQANSCDQTGLVLPLYDYSHDNGACSVTGGYVYRGNDIPEINGHYFFADFCAGWVRSLVVTAGAAGQLVEWPALAPGSTITSFGVDARGELYLVGGGAVHRIVKP